MKKTPKQTQLVSLSIIMSFQKSWIDKETSWDASPAFSVHISAFCCGSLMYESSEHCRGNE